MHEDAPDRATSWERRYRASVAEEQRVLDGQSPWLPGNGFDAYMRVVLFLAALLVGGIIMLRTGELWWMLVGGVLAVAVVLAIIGFATRRFRS